jgi:hypothetical protein
VIRGSFISNRGVDYDNVSKRKVWNYRTRASTTNYCADASSDCSLQTYRRERRPLTWVENTQPLTVEFDFPEGLSARQHHDLIAANRVTLDDLRKVACHCSGGGSPSRLRGLWLDKRESIRIELQQRDLLHVEIIPYSSISPIEQAHAFLLVTLHSLEGSRVPNQTFLVVQTLKASEQARDIWPLHWVHGEIMKFQL